MKHVLVLILIFLVVAVTLPMGMGEMGECPMCISTSTIALGMCAAILSVFVLVVLLDSSRLRHCEQQYTLSLLSRAIYRPPRRA